MENKLLFYGLWLVIAFGCFVIAFITIGRQRSSIEELAMANHKVFYLFMSSFVAGVVIGVLVIFDGVKTILFP